LKNHYIISVLATGYHATIDRNCEDNSKLKTTYDSIEKFGTPFFRFSDSVITVYGF